MCKFIGIEVLAANALIDIMDNDKSGEVQASVTFDELYNYGMAVVHFINEKYHEGAVILYNNDGPTTDRFINCSDLIECDGECVRVREGVEFDTLYRRFRVTLAYEILAAVYADEVRSILRKRITARA